MNNHDLARFEAKVSIDPETGCWDWQAGTDKDGYGRFRLNGKTQAAHRVSYVEHNGPIPKGLEIDHTECQNRACVNPEHLEAVTHAENVRRGRAGRFNSEKTHCVHGHEYSGENLIIQKDGSRKCRACHRACALASYHRNKS